MIKSEHLWVSTKIKSLRLVKKWQNSAHVVVECPLKEATTATKGGRSILWFHIFPKVNEILWVFFLDSAPVFAFFSFFEVIVAKFPLLEAIFSNSVLTDGIAGLSL